MILIIKKEKKNQILFLFDLTSLDEPRKIISLDSINLYSYVLGEFFENYIFYIILCILVILCDSLVYIFKLFILLFSFRFKKK